jgi:hypothetical protein
MKHLECMVISMLLHLQYDLLLEQLAGLEKVSCVCFVYYK